MGIRSCKSAVGGAIVAIALATLGCGGGPQAQGSSKADRTADAGPLRQVGVSGVFTDTIHSLDANVKFTWRSILLQNTANAPLRLKRFRIHHDRAQLTAVAAKVLPLIGGRGIEFRWPPSIPAGEGSVVNFHGATLKRGQTRLVAIRVHRKAGGTARVGGITVTYADDGDHEYEEAFKRQRLAVCDKVRQCD